MLDRSLIQSPSSLTITSLPSAPTGFSSAPATSNTKLHHFNINNNNNNNNRTRHSLHSTIQQYDSLGLPSSTTSNQNIKNSSKLHEQRQDNSFIMQQLQNLKQHQQPTSTTPPNSGPIKAELIDAKFNQLAKRVLSQLNQKPVEFFHSLDNILTEPLDQHEIEMRAARQAAEAVATKMRQSRRTRSKRTVNQDDFYEKNSGNIVNVTGNTPPSTRTKAIRNKNDHKLSSHNYNNHYHSSIERISSPSHNHHVANIINGRSSAERRQILQQAQMDQLVYSDQVDDEADFDDDDDDDDDYDESFDDKQQNYVIHGDTSRVNLENVFINNNTSNRQAPLKGIVKKTNSNNNNLAHLNPIMRSNSLGAKNDLIVKVKSPTKNIITSPNRLQQAPCSLQKSRTSHDSLSIKTTITGNTNNNKNTVQPMLRGSLDSRHSHPNSLLMSSSQQHEKFDTINDNNNKSSKMQADPNSNQLQSDHCQDLNSLYKRHINYSTSLLANQHHRLSDDDEIIIIPTKSPSLISNPSPDPDFASNSGLDIDDEAAAAAAAAAANERFSISRTKSFWEKLSNNKTARGVNRRASAAKSLSTSLIGNSNNNNNNSVTTNLNNNHLGSVNSRISTSENNNNHSDYKHQSLTNQNYPNDTANENISTMDNQQCYDRYHYNNY